MSLELIEQLVQEKAGQRTDEVVGLLFSKVKAQHIKEAHLGDCECGYCQLLKQYTRMKINLHHLTKRLNWEDFEVVNSNKTRERISMRISDVASLRQLKNQEKLR